MINVVLLWHMHQPYYVNPLTGTSLMPWVRLHAVKGYLDMIHSLNSVPEMRATFNFTPVLVKQVEELRRGTVRDLWEEWSIKPAEDLTSHERISLLEHFFKANWDNLIKPYPRYWELLQRRGFHFNKVRMEHDHELFSAQDYRDLQVWFNLAWCGYSACKLFPELVELKKKGKNFSEEDKSVVLSIHRKILGRVLSDYKDAEASGRIETTTTPFYHPILPLVYDTDFAKRCMPWRDLPERFSAPDDALQQLKLAVAQHEQIFGKKPSGLWPSEGSVAPELIPLFQECGIRYFFTDEGVLFRGLHQDPMWQGKTIDHLELFQGWRCEHEASSASALFRERPLSDFIGFNAARNTAEAASDHLIHHLCHLDRVVNKSDGVVALVLDGENAWEYFADGGEHFIKMFYEKLCKNEHLRPVLPGEYFAAHTPKATLKKLHTGSWINSDFDIWIGDHEENRGWEMIRETRAFLVKNQHRVSQELREKAWESIFAAEGSDWFWWYGPDFSTECDVLFDELFRSHLQNVYRYLGQEPPPALSVQICEVSQRLAFTKPSALISPDINGLVSSYFEYFGAGCFDTAQQSSAMYQSERIIQSIWFGNDQESITIRADFKKIPEGTLRLKLAGQESVFSMDMPIGPQVSADTVEILMPDGTRTQIPAQVSTEQVTEVRIPLASLSIKAGEEINLSVQFLQNGVETERHPEQGSIGFTLLSCSTMTRDWCV